MINSIVNSEKVNEESVKSDIKSILGSRFISVFEEKTEVNISEPIDNNLLPNLRKIVSDIEKEKLAEELTKEILNFIRKCFIQIRTKLNDEYPNGIIPSKFERNHPR